LRIRTRLEWLAQPPVDEISDLKTPAPNVIIIHSATEGCFNTADCIVTVSRVFFRSPQPKINYFIPKDCSRNFSFKEYKHSAQKSADWDSEKKNDKEKIEVTPLLGILYPNNNGRYLVVI